VGRGEFLARRGNTNRVNGLHDSRLLGLAGFGRVKFTDFATAIDDRLLCERTAPDDGHGTRGCRRIGYRDGHPHHLLITIDLLMLTGLLMLICFQMLTCFQMFLQ